MSCSQRDNALNRRQQHEFDVLMMADGCQDHMALCSSLIMHAYLCMQNMHACVGSYPEQLRESAVLLCVLQHL